MNPVRICHHGVLAAVLALAGCSAPDVRQTPDSAVATRSDAAFAATDATLVPDSGAARDGGTTADAEEPDAGSAPDAHQADVGSGTWRLVDRSDEVPVELVTHAFRGEYWNRDDGLIQTWSAEDPENCSSEPAGCLRLFRHHGGAFTPFPTPTNLTGLGRFSFCVPRQDRPTRAFAVAEFADGSWRTFRLDLADSPVWTEDTADPVDLPSTTSFAAVACVSADEMLAVGATQGEPASPVAARYRTGMGWSRLELPPAASNDVWLLSLSIDAASGEGWLGGMQLGQGRQSFWPALYALRAGAVKAEDSLLSSSGWPDYFSAAGSVFQASGSPPFAVAMSNGLLTPALVYEGGRWTPEELPKPATGDGVACANVGGMGRTAFMVCGNNYTCTGSILVRQAGGAWSIAAEAHGNEAYPACSFGNLSVRDENHLLISALTPRSSSRTNAAWELVRE